MPMIPTTRLYITDKNGGKHFNTICSTAYNEAEYRNLMRHLMAAEKNPEAYKFLDNDSAQIIEEAVE